MHKMISQMILLFLLVLPNSSMAKDLGKQATSFEIKEEPFTQALKRKLADLDIEAEQKKMENIARDRVENPIPVPGITEAKEDRIFYFDPSYLLEKDIILPCGKILHKAGTTVNPLEHVDLERRLLFIDARNKEQIEWLKIKLRETVDDASKQLEDRIILVGGSPFELEKELGVNIYFDQNGELTNRFGIKAVPATAMQEGLMIRIEEVAV